MSSKHLNAQYNLRWPDELKEKIAQSAKKHNRSMNADIVARLEQSLANEELPTITQADKDYLTKIQSIEEKLDMIINNTDVLKKAP
ncbi:Arc family DNA-binding protein [Acinetobacter guillouiae]|jgi:plasmid stability protein|uniref:Arc family DNA-binding protein n=1 Tax=Acinetobacter TaxID=469 RepID=UPI00264FA82E|nr:Arc family DNA-binding protein [Acinetobacter sp.]